MKDKVTHQHAERFKDSSAIDTFLLELDNIIQDYEVSTAQESKENVDGD